MLFFPPLIPVRQYFMRTHKTLFTKYCSISLEKRLNSESAFQLYLRLMLVFSQAIPSQFLPFQVCAFVFYLQFDGTRCDEEIKTKQKIKYEKSAHSRTVKTQKMIKTEHFHNEHANNIEITMLKWCSIYEKWMKLKCLRILSLS